jgi:hypothetical protein
MERQSYKMHQAYLVSEEKFDYFILGVIGALSAYLSQNITFLEFGFNNGTLGLVALLIIIVSGIFGYNRIEKCILVKKIDVKIASSYEDQENYVSAKSDSLIGGVSHNKLTGERLSTHDVNKKLEYNKQLTSNLNDKVELLIDKTVIYYRLRNWCLILGFILIVIAKVLPVN